MAPAKSTRAPAGNGSSFEMRRSSTNTSSASNSHHGHGHGHHSHGGSGGPPHGGTCSCGNPIHPGSSSGSKHLSPYHDLGLSSPSKPLTTAAALKRQRELRDFALVSLFLVRNIATGPADTRSDRLTSCFHAFSGYGSTKTQQDYTQLDLL